MTQIVFLREGYYTAKDLRGWIEIDGSGFIKAKDGERHVCNPGFHCIKIRAKQMEVTYEYEEIYTINVKLEEDESLLVYVITDQYGYLQGSPNYEIKSLSREETEAIASRRQKAVDDEARVTREKREDRKKKEKRTLIIVLVCIGWFFIYLLLSSGLLNHILNYIVAFFSK